MIICGLIISVKYAIIEALEFILLTRGKLENKT